MGVERRRHTRVSVEWSARVLRKGQGVFMARVANISLGGCRFVCSQKVPVGSRVMIELLAPAGAGVHKLLAEAQVLHVGGGDEAFNHGVEFKRIGDADLWWILAFVAESAGTGAGQHRPAS